MVKKGQMKIQQTAFLIIALTLFFVLVGLFVLGMAFSGVKSQKATIEEENAMKLISKLANSPEFTCGMAFYREKSSCVDFDKVMALRTRIENYTNFWGVDGIEIRKIYPEVECTDLECDCTIENYPDCNYLEILPTSVRGQGFAKSTFVSLCYKTNLDGIVHDKCELAKLIVRFSDENSTI